MSVVKELLRGEESGAISFGDYTLEQKGKLEDYEFHGDLYKVKTCQEITRLEKNGLFVYESVPGSAVNDFVEKENGVSFKVEGTESVQITLGLAEATEYVIYVDEQQVGLMETNRSGKLSISVETAGKEVEIKIVQR